MQKSIDLPVSGGVDLKRLIVIAAIIVGVIGSIVLARNTEEESALPVFISDWFQFEEWVNQAEDWLKENYREFTRAIAGVIEEALYFVEDFLVDSPWIFW